MLQGKDYSFVDTMFTFIASINTELLVSVTKSDQQHFLLANSTIFAACTETIVEQKT